MMGLNIAALGVGVLLHSFTNFIVAFLVEILLWFHILIF